MHTSQFSNELYHHGIKGQKWGIRRYRNRDGTLTDLGKRHIGGGKKENRVEFDESTGRITDEASSRNATMKINKRVSSDYSSASGIGNAAANMARTGSNLSNRRSQRRMERERSKAKSEIDTSKMSNQELQQAITRMNLERQYKDLKTSDLSSGRSAVSDILADGGDIVAIAAGVATIASTIYAMK